MRIADLMKVADQPDIRAAIDAHSEALEVRRRAAEALRNADRLVDQREAELEELVNRSGLVLAVRGRRGLLGLRLVLHRDEPRLRDIRHRMTRRRGNVIHPARHGSQSAPGLQVHVIVERKGLSTHVGSAHNPPRQALIISQIATVRSAS